MAYCIKLSELNESTQRIVSGPWKGLCEDCQFLQSSSSSYENLFFACVGQIKDPNLPAFCIGLDSYNEEEHNIVLGPFFGIEDCDLCGDKEEPSPGGSSSTSGGSSSTSGGSSGSSSTSGYPRAMYYCVEQEMESLGFSSSSSSSSSNKTTNTANFKGCARWPFDIDPLRANVTTVGTNGGPSHYGTYDQMGNVWEWTDTPEGTRKNLQRRYGFGDSSSNFNKETVFNTPANDVSNHGGFRIATLDDPSFIGNFATVGDAGNLADTNGKGSVPYQYSIAIHPVTNEEYATFLNFVADSSNYSLWSPLMSSEVQGGIERTGSPGSYTYQSKPKMGNKPVVFITWFAAAKYCNWLHNRSFFGGSVGFNIPIETGSYDLNNSTDSIAKNEGAKYWIPTDDEWYKAAFYKGGGTSSGYWNYATQSDEEPSCVQANEDGDGLTESGSSSSSSSNSNSFSNTFSKCIAVEYYNPLMGKILDGPFYFEKCSECESTSSSSSSGPPPITELPPVPTPTGFGDTHHTWSPKQNNSSTSFLELYTGPLVFMDDNSPASGKHGVIEWVERHYDGSVHGWVSTRESVCIFEGTNICTDLTQIGNPKAQMQKECKGLYASGCGGCDVDTTWCQISISMPGPGDVSEIESVGGLYVNFIDSLLSSVNPQGGGFNQIGKSTSFSNGGCVIPEGSDQIGHAATTSIRDLRDKLSEIDDEEDWAPLSQAVLNQRMAAIAALSSKANASDPCCGAPEWMFGDGPCSKKEEWGERSCMYKCDGSSWTKIEGGFCNDCSPPTDECSPAHVFLPYFEFGKCNDCTEGYSTPCGCLPSGCKCVDGSPVGNTCPPESSSSSYVCNEQNCAFTWLYVGPPSPESCELSYGPFSSFKEAEEVRTEQESLGCFYSATPQPGYCCDNVCSPEECKEPSSSSSSVGGTPPPVTCWACSSPKECSSSPILPDGEGNCPPPYWNNKSTCENACV